LAVLLSVDPFNALTVAALLAAARLKLERVNELAEVDGLLVPHPRWARKGGKSARAAVLDDLAGGAP
jgi:hypothetical protein